MSEFNPTPPNADKLEALHERVNEMLDVPLPKESEAWSLPLEEAITNTGAGYEPQTPADSATPAGS